MPAYRPSARHAELGPAFFDPVEAADFPVHELRFRNQRWAARVGLDDLDADAWIAHFGRFAPLPGSLSEPLALRYHGHQFRVYNPDLGDGRGFLHAQLHDLVDGRLLDLGTKGSGRTPWSRSGDGRLTLKGAVREVLATEMLEALGVDTSKTFSVIETGEQLHRGDEPSPTRAAVLVRLSHSHIRIGTFQRQLFLAEHDNIAALLDHSIRSYMPELWREAVADRAAAFLAEVCRRVARTGGQWMAAGFVHGVLNSDNINITGESFDYGPWRFLPELDPAFTAAYFDQGGLYAFGRQPEALAWNLARLGECLLPLASLERLQAVLEGFEPALHAAFALAVLRRLGLASAGAEADDALARAIWHFLSDSRAPFAQVFHDWHGGVAAAHRAAGSPAADHYHGESFDRFQTALEPFRPSEAGRAGAGHFDASPLCDLTIDEVEALWAPIAESDDWQPFEVKIAAIRALGTALGNTPAMPDPATG
ncbi:protein adenylyltransferase SelO [Marinibaculum pumilum]|uniref:Protein nucleotidyltransferase YdiU n=1 Tax=Marinibaculum pumilum TaxID=1766165 RepID=A0ABV7KX01_9PROT